MQGEPVGRPVWALGDSEYAVFLSPLRPLSPSFLPQREGQRSVYSCGPSSSSGLGPLPFSLTQQFHPLLRFQLILLPLSVLGK